MRKPAFLGVFLLLLLGACAGAWVLLSPSDRPAPQVEVFALDGPQVSDGPEPLAHSPLASSEPQTPIPAAPKPDPGASASRPVVAPEEQASPSGAPAAPEAEPDEFDLDEDREASGESRETVVIVTLEGSAATPAEAWLSWEEDDGSEQQSADFDPGTGEARIAWLTGDVEGNAAQGGRCRARAKWFGMTLASDVLTVKPGHEHKANLPLPAGASLTVRVRDSAGQPVAQARVQAGKVSAVTNASGEGVFSGLPAPSELEVRLAEIDGSACCVPVQTVRFRAPAESQDLLFDLDGTGTVDCELTAGGESLETLDISSPDGSGSGTVSFAETSSTRIFGLRPGKYRVVAGFEGYEQSYAAEFDVVPPPEVSLWKHDFTTYSLAVKLRGAPSDVELRLGYCGEDYSDVQSQVSSDGTYLLEGLAGNVLRMVIYGRGWVSDAHIVDPKQVSEIRIDVFQAGTLKLIARGNSPGNFDILGVEPVRETLRLFGSSRPRGQNSVELAAGRYLVSSEDLDDTLEVTVRAGEVTECFYGPEFTCTIELHTRDRLELEKFDYAIFKDGQPVAFERCLPEDEDESFALTIEGEGRLALRVTGAGIEDFEREIEIERNTTIPLELELKQRQ